ncbi:MAG: hypothetical protein PHN82_00785 [bacterium]|nr:hypothetical protein [bacterium]
MRYVAWAMLAAAGLAAGCVSVDLGQASKDWSEVGKSWADAYTSADPAAAGTQAPPAP